MIAVRLVQLAGVAQLAIVLARFALPRKLDLATNLRRLNPIVRQIFVVHHVFLVATGVA